MEQINITLLLALLLSIGFLFAKAGHFFKLPSVTGYILAGLLMGPSGINVIPAETVGHQLDHFTQIALMLIAFGIGEHLEIKRLKSSLASVSLIGIGEILGAFFCVCLGSYLIGQILNVGGLEWQRTDYVILAFLLGAVSVATAPAATLHVVRELKAYGPLTTTLLAVVAIDNGLAIMMFGITISVAHNLMTVTDTTIASAITASFFEIAGSLTLGLAGGFLIDYINSKLKQHGEMLTVGLAILLLCGELATLLNFSSLLAGMAAAFIIVNRDHRDLRLFRALNSFEPPIYVLFFTLAGVHLDLQYLTLTGWLGLAYFIFRCFGKIVGSGIGAKIARAPQPVERYIGMALVPQAGVAIGLLFLISNDLSLAPFAGIISSTVLTGVILSELFGPILAKQAVVLAKEVPSQETDNSPQPLPHHPNTKESAPQGVPMVPWTWEKLTMPPFPDGVVLFGANHIATTRALARMAAIFANFYSASPMAIRVLPQKEGNGNKLQDTDPALLITAKAETVSMGMELYTFTQQSDNTAQAIIASARQNRAKAIVLGHCQEMTPAIFQKVIGEVANQAPCPTLVVKFSGVLHTERILVTIVSMKELYEISDVIRALSIVGQHQISLLYLLPSYENQDVQNQTEIKMRAWAEQEQLRSVISCQALATDARQETVISKAKKHDLVILAAPRLQGIPRLFFGSLAHAVASKCPTTLITVYPPASLNHRRPL